MIRIILHPAFSKPKPPKLPQRLHGRFIAMLDGRKLCVSREPLLAASRVLLGEGMAPETVIVARHAGSDFDAMRSTVGQAAKWTVREDEKISPTFVRWMPFPDTRRVAPVR